MKTRILKLVLVLALAMALLAIPVVGLADAGNFSSDSDWGGGSDWGSSDWGSSDWGDSSYSSGSTYFIGGSDDGEGGGIFGIIAVVVIVIIVLAVISKGKGGISNAAAQQQAHAAAAAQRAMMNSSLDELKSRDPNFSEEAIKEHIANLYVEMQNCWQEKKWEPMRTHLTDSMYNQMGRQLDALKRNKQTNYIDRISVLGVDLAGYGKDDTNDIIQAVLRTRITDYTVDDTTGNVINGDKSKELYMTYQWTLIRSQGVLTRDPKETEKTAQHCTSCGAPIDVNHTAKCEYCGTVVTASEYDWVLSAVKGISQRSQG